jgi:hypothetical protein
MSTNEHPVSINENSDEIVFPLQSEGSGKTIQYRIQGTTIVSRIVAYPEEGFYSQCPTAYCFQSAPSLRWPMSTVRSGNQGG